MPHPPASLISHTWQSTNKQPLVELSLHTRIANIEMFTTGESSLNKYLSHIVQLPVFLVKNKISLRNLHCSLSSSSVFLSLVSLDIYALILSNYLSHGPLPLPLPLSSVSRPPPVPDLPVLQLQRLQGHGDRGAVTVCQNISGEETRRIQGL